LISDRHRGKLLFLTASDKDRETFERKFLGDLSADKVTSVDNGHSRVSLLQGVLPVSFNLAYSNLYRRSPGRFSSQLRAVQGLSELVLEDLASRRCRQDIEHDDFRRPLVGGKLRADESHQVG
jgi:hypothetical protein